MEPQATAFCGFTKPLIQRSRRESRWSGAVLFTSATAHALFQTIVMALVAIGRGRFESAKTTKPRIAA
jgi:hypothetical protein